MQKTGLLIAALWLLASCGMAYSATEVPRPTEPAEETHPSVSTDTPEPTEIPEPTYTQKVTDTPGPTNTPSPSPRPTTTPTVAATVTAWPTDTATPRPEPAVRVSSSTANVRSGPGTNYPAIGVLEQGDTVLVIATNVDGSWYNILLAEGTTGWLAASVAEPVDQEAMSLLTAALTIPAPPPTLTPFQPTRRISATTSPSSAPSAPLTTRTATPEFDPCVTPPIRTATPTSVTVRPGATSVPAATETSLSQAVRSGNRCALAPSIVWAGWSHMAWQRSTRVGS
jgi:uncharacterized protein YgiM (DUF1202 family)